MIAKKNTRLFVLDTNVLMHDPNSIFQFEEHDIYLPMVVLEELDSHKKGATEIARNVRLTNRLLDKLIEGKDHAAIEHGLPLQSFAPAMAFKTPPQGRLFFQFDSLPLATLPANMPGNKPDNSILALTLALRSQVPTREVILVSKDINLRIKAGILGIPAEDYFSDQVLEDITQLHTGIHILPEDFWTTHGKKLESWQTGGRTYYRLKGPLIEKWCLNDGVYTQDEKPLEALVREVKDGTAVVELAHDYRNVKHTVWGINARNTEQNFALNALLNPDIDLVTLVGVAGSGKTLLALAAGLAQTMEQPRYREIIVTRITVPIGEDIGFLPGTEEEKMAPWMGALIDNLEVLNSSHRDNTDWERAATHDFLRSRLKIRSLNFMRGRTFLNKFIVIDEAQNLTPKQMKTLITRAGPGTKIVCIGDISQIDTPYLTETNCGLTYVVDRFKSWEHSAHVTLVRGERSRLSETASQWL